MKNYEQRLRLPTEDLILFQICELPEFSSIALYFNKDLTEISEELIFKELERIADQKVVSLESKSEHQKIDCELKDLSISAWVTISDYVFICLIKSSLQKRNFSGNHRRTFSNRRSNHR